MNATFHISSRRFSLLLTMAVGLLTLNSAFAITTNGNGGSTDVGTWYEQIFPLTDPPGPYDQWASTHFGMNNLPLIDWAVLAGTTSSYSGTFAQYDSSNSTVIANDMAALAAAKIDFVLIDMTNGGLGGLVPGNNWTATYADAVMAGAAAWNASNSWKIRVAFAIGSNNLGSQGPVVEAQAQDIYNNYYNNSAYGNPTNWYAINGMPLLVVYGGGTASGWSSYCASNTCTYGNYFQLEYAYNQGAGQWGWFLPPSGTQVDPAGLVEQVSPGWINYYGFTWDTRNDGAFYANNWNVVFNNPYPRIVMLAAYNDWLEQQGLWVNNTISAPSSLPSPQSDVDDPSARMPEVWTGPDGNVTLNGYWNYTVAAINYLRSGGTKPYWPQVASNLAPNATATASSTVNSTWAASYVNDGNPSTGWSSVGHSSGNNTEWIQLHNSSNPTFNTVVLMGRNDLPVCFPVNFQIQVWNGSTWLTRVQETNFPQPAIPGTPIAFTWGFSDTTTDVRILATELSPDGYGNYYMQVGEFEVLNEGSTANAPMFANWGFEAPAMGGAGNTSGSFQYGPFTNGWTFNANAGVQQVGSAWNSYMPPQGAQTAFLQGSSSSISQAITLPAGSYTIRFLAAQRSGTGGAQAIDAYFDSTQIGSWTSIPNSWTPYVTNSFTSAGGSHTITFNGLNAGDNTVFIDEVQIFNQ